MWHLKVLGHFGVPSDIREYDENGRHNHDAAGGQTVQTVRQVYSIRTAYDCENCDGEASSTNAGGNRILVKRDHHFCNQAARIRNHPKINPDEAGEERLYDQLDQRGSPQVVLPGNLRVVVVKPETSQNYERQKSQYDQFVPLGPEQSRQIHSRDDQETSHRGGAFLAENPCRYGAGFFGFIDVVLSKFQPL